MKNKTLLFTRIFLMIILTLPIIYAETETYKVNENVELKFTCTLNNAIPSAAARYNITINYPNGSTYLSNVATTALGNGAFNYATSFPTTGLYKVQMFCVDGVYSFSDEGFYDITSTGIIPISIWNYPVLIILALLGLGLVILGASKGIPWFGFIGSIMFLLLGIYTMIYGFNNVVDMYTRGVAITLLGLGLIFMFSSAWEFFTEDGEGTGAEED